MKKVYHRDSFYTGVCNLDNNKVNMIWITVRIS